MMTSIQNKSENNDEWTKAEKEELLANIKMQCNANGTSDITFLRSSKSIDWSTVSTVTYFWFYRLWEAQFSSFFSNF